MTAVHVKKSLSSAASPVSKESRNERVMVCSCCAALAALIPVALHQLGALPHLPDPPGRMFNSDKITSSKAAHPFGVPDSLLGLGNFAMTLGLILFARRSSRARKLLRAKLVVDASMAGFNAIRQVVSFGQLCSWCTATGLATGVMVYAGRGSSPRRYER